MKNKKVIFICGSIGSGKTTLSEKYFSNFTKINIDTIYENLLIENNLGLKIIDFNTEEKLKSDELFNLSKKYLDEKLFDSIKKEENIVIDSVGRDIEVTTKSKYFLESIGYTAHMIMVYCNLDVCLRRVKNRDRVYHKNVVINSWYESYENLVAYQKIFKNRFILIQSDIEISEILDL